MIYLLYPSKKEQKKLSDAAYYQSHKDEIKKRTKAYQQTDKYKIHKKASGKQWRQQNPDYLKNYYSTHKENINQKHKEYYQKNKHVVLDSNKKWAQTHPLELRTTKNRYKKTDKGKLSGAKYHEKRRGMGSNLLNEWFEGCNRYHITKNDIICIPEKLHKFNGHNHRKPDTMKLINIRAWDYLEASVL